MSLSSKYDFIFLGAGCASLSLVMRMIKSGKFADKKILLIDRHAKTKNDRTWCFWEKQDGFFEEIVYKKWDTISFLSDSFSSDLSIAPYQYKMIRGIDLYQYCFRQIEQHNNIDIHYGDITAVYTHDGTTIHFGDDTEHFDHVTIFNSALPGKTTGIDTINLLQHFKGWIIETTGPVFDPAKATFMDFRVDQARGTTFAYVLPLTQNKALVEYTLFSENVLKDEEYEEELRTYITKYLECQSYSVIEKEFGVIPMSTGRFNFSQNSTYYNIGTVGGQTKASSGYTFRFIQKQSDLIVDHLINNRDLRKIRSAPKRFLFYDNVLLDVLHHKRVTGKDIFTTMFKKNRPQQVLKFLDNESSLKEELKIISTLPILPFLRAALNQL